MRCTLLLRRYMMFLGLSPEDADDGVQEAFLSPSQASLDRAATAPTLRGWLFHVGAETFAARPAQECLVEANAAGERSRERCSETSQRNVAANTDVPSGMDERLFSVEDSRILPRTGFLKEERLGMAAIPPQSSG